MAGESVLNDDIKEMFLNVSSLVSESMHPSIRYVGNLLLFPFPKAFQECGL